MTLANDAERTELCIFALLMNKYSNTFIVSTELDGRHHRVELDSYGSSSSGGQRVALAETDIPNVWEWIDGSERVPVHIVSDGMSSVVITIRGYSYTAKVFKEQHHDLLDILNASPIQKQRVTRIPAPMPGLLKSIITSEGAHVRKGDTLFTLEAMKMENAIKTPVAGIVRHVTTNVGVALEKGALLCVVEPLLQQ